VLRALEDSITLLEKLRLPLRLSLARIDQPQSSHDFSSDPVCQKVQKIDHARVTLPRPAHWNSPPVNSLVT
jgi:hypothetical protein